MEVGDSPAGGHSGTLLPPESCLGLGNPKEVSPAWGQPCGAFPPEEEGPPQPGPSADRAMTTLEDPSALPPGGASELRWVLRVPGHREKKGHLVGRKRWHPLGRAGLAPVLPPGRKRGCLRSSTQEALRLLFIYIVALNQPPSPLLRGRTSLSRKHDGLLQLLSPL